MSTAERRVLHIGVQLERFTVEDRFLRSLDSLGAGEFDARPLIRTAGAWSLSPLTYLTLARLIRRIPFDAVCLFIPGWPNLFEPFPHRHPGKNLARAPGALAYYGRYGLLYALIRRCPAPLLIFDRLDSSVIDKRWHPFLARCRVYYKRELPKSTVNAFLYSERMAIEPWRNLLRYGAHLPKLRPFTDGLPDEVLSVPVEGVRKSIDLMWAGALDISPVRTGGMPLLRRLGEKGYTVHLLEKKVSKEEFYRLVQSSYLLWSPEGTGWQCFKHYEACAMESVPVISYPTIWQDMPLIEGVHCLYYDPEGEGLIGAVERALKDRDRLVAMGKGARTFVLRYKTTSASYVRCVFAALEGPLRTSEGGVPRSRCQTA